MRDVLRRLGRGMPSHVGLAYDVWAPVERHDGKLATAHGEQRAWLEGVRGIAIDPDYAAAYARWSESFAHDGRCAVVQTTSRLLVGHGNASATDVGLTVHHAWGVPMIPGSALAGVTARYVDAELGGPGPERERWRGPEYDDAGVVERLPGDRYGCLFGVPELGGDPGARGLVTFCDALYVPGSAGGDRPFREDVLTVHHKAYYDGRGSVPPTDYEDPNPVSLLTVGRGVRFLLAVTGPAEWTAVAMTLLCEALARRGVGGKTSSGYGRLGVVWSERGEEGGARRGATATARATSRRAPTTTRPIRGSTSWAVTAARPALTPCCAEAPRSTRGRAARSATNAAASARESATSARSSVERVGTPWPPGAMPRAGRVCLGCGHEPQR